ncbi:DUF7133 domain-containing protein [Membranihabitans marinus]|uniref:DUF7133 domain-containing protein n=1 Tax=Membranihabitans marinus TaxID=1227546 RepID=UPI001F02C6B3|nr:c-type cytochrome [Membranihabitans marinus]
MKYIFQILTLLCLINFSSCTYTVDVSENEPPIDLSHYQVQDGFELEMIASEPLVEAPVDIVFDPSGKLWVIEMKGYMTDYAGSEEKLPSGQISFLEDRDNNGRMDTKTVFLDSLVLPRAMKFVNGGLLYSTPPSLWWVPIEKGNRPGKKVLVDDDYAVGGNVEHQPNGLMYHSDNWIYNAKSNKRYRYRNGKWEEEYIFLRGQWGITQDSLGYIYTNDNSNQFKGDYFLPGILDNNKNLATPPGVNLSVVRDQSVYPLHPTAVNRGYMEGILDPETKILNNFTSACGPLFYQANGYNGLLNGQAFACGPEANLIKRNLVSYEDVAIKGEQYYDNKEFIVVDDETFRPVNLKTGPDGLIYIVDMHRGLLQHKTYLTSYLRNQYGERKLDTLVNSGRILRINHENVTPSPIRPIQNLSSADLIQLLGDDNPWYRLNAQQLLVERNDASIADQLRTLIKESNSTTAQLHSFWTLEGLNALTNQDLHEAVDHNPDYFMGHVVKILMEQPKLMDNGLKSKLYNYWKNTSQLKNKFYLTAIYSSISDQTDNVELMEFIEGLSPKNKQYAVYFALANKEGQESSLIQPLMNLTKSQPEIQADLDKLQQRIASNIDYYAKVKANAGKTDSGLEIFESNCATCHGRDGKGIDHVAPPFYHSEYIEGRDTSLALIVLHGLKGPLTVNGKLYEFPSVMPGLVENTEYSDREIASVLSYIKNAFGRKPKSLSPNFIKAMRAHKPAANEVYTEETLKQKVKELK